MGHAEPVQDLVDPVLPAGGAHIGREAQAGRVLEGPAQRQLAVQDVLLGNQADAVPQLGVVVVEVPAAVEHLTLPGGVQTRQGAEERGLPRAGRADDGEQGALRQGEADVVDQGLAAPTGHGDAAHLEGDRTLVEVLLQATVDEQEVAVAHADEVELVQHVPTDAHPVDVGAVEAAQVDDLGRPVRTDPELGMVPGDQQVVEHDVVVLGAADPHPLGRHVTGLERAGRPRRGGSGRGGRPPTRRGTGVGHLDVVDPRLERERGAAPGVAQPHDGRPGQQLLVHPSAVEPGPARAAPVREPPTLGRGPHHGVDPAGPLVGEADGARRRATDVGPPAGGHIEGPALHDHTQTGAVHRRLTIPDRFAAVRR